MSKRRLNHRGCMYSDIDNFWLNYFYKYNYWNNLGIAPYIYRQHGGNRYSQVCENRWILLKMNKNKNLETMDKKV